MTKFKIEKDFIARIPYYTYNVFSKDLQTIDIKNIKSYLKKIKFEENILTSSSSLFESIFSEKISNDSYDSCIKYLIRASTRCTPYGLNSAIVQGIIDDKERKKIDKNFYKKAKPDMEWLVKVIRKTEKIIGGELNVSLNNTLKYNEVTIEKNWNSFYCTDMVLGGKTIINYTNAIKEIFRVCREKYITINKIIAVLNKKYPSMTNEFLSEFIKTLLDKEFIISNLRPCLVVVNQFEYFLESINKYEIEQNYLSEISYIKELFDKYNELIVSVGSAQYSELLTEMKKICESENYIAVDMFQKNKISIKEARLEVIKDFSDFLISWGLIDTYDDFINKFIDRYGDQAVKYTDLIDEEIGLGVPSPNKRNLILLNDNFTSELFKTVIAQKKEREYIDISSMINENYVDTKENVFFQLAVFPLCEKGKDIFLLSNLVGGKGLDKIDGRFKYILDKSLCSNRKTEEDIVDVEITYHSFLSRHANVQLTTPSTNYILEYGSRTEGCELKRIKLEDIYVFIDQNRKIRFVDKNSNKILLFRVSSAFNQIYCPNILKPLLDISEKQTNAVFTIYNHLDHLISKVNGHFPRVVFKNIIVIPESWKLDKHFFDKDGNIVNYNQFLYCFNQLVNSEKIPGVISVGPFDQKMTLNIKKEEHLKILHSILKKDSNLAIYESIISEDNLILENDENQPYLGEVIFNLKKEGDMLSGKFSPEEVPFIESKEQWKQTFVPFDKWISIKLYMEKSMNNIILRENIDNLHTKLMTKGWIEDLFYIRYEDPKQHIRLRIKINQEFKSEIFDLVRDFALDLDKNNTIHDCVIDSYCQEYSRYGGIEHIELAEKFFTFDSIVSVNILKAIKQKIVNYKMEDIFIISSFKILLDMGIDLEKQVEYLADYILDKEAVKKFREAKNITYLQEIIDTDMHNMSNSVEGLSLLSILEERNRVAREYWISIENSKLTEHRKKIIICSVLHMHFNRLIGIDRMKENELTSYLRKILFIKLNKIKYAKKEMQ